MNVVHLVTRSDAIGGAHVHVRDLSIALKRKGHTVRVLAGGDGAFFADLARHGIEHEPVPNLVREIHPIKDTSAFLYIRNRLRALGPDLVSTHSSKAGWIGRLAARSLGIPVTFTAHGWAFTEGIAKAPSYLYEIAERVAATFASRIITVSHYDKQLALRRRIASAEKMVTIHQGTPEIEAELFADPVKQPPRIVKVARFERQKNHSAVLEALAGIRELNWTLDLVGDGPLRSGAERLAEQLGIRDRVQFLGTRADVDRILSEAQIFVLISGWEGLPISVLEGMRAGLPVVASEVAGVPEAVIDGITGFIIGRGDARTLEARLRTLISDPVMRVRMGRSGRERYEQHFTFDRMVTQTLDVYVDAIQRLTEPTPSGGDHGI